MRKWVLSIMSIVAVSMVFSSCGTLFTTGGSDYRDAAAFHERMDYVRAIQSLEKALAVNPTFPEALELYPVVFNEGTAHLKEIVRNNESKDDRLSADQVYNAYKNLQKMHSLARMGNLGIVVAGDYSSKLEAAAKEAGQRWFDWGESLFAQGGRNRFKQAVNAFETAKARDPQIPEIDRWIQEALDQATVTLMVLGNGPDEAFHTMVLNDIKKTFSTDRFVKVLETESFRDVETMVGPTDLAIHHGMANNVDYLIDVSVYNRVETMREEESVRLPSSQPLFDGKKVTIGYTVKNLVTYRLFSLDQVRVTAGNTFTLEDGPFTFEISFAVAEGVRELNLGNTGRRNLRYVTSSVDPMTTSQAINALRRDFSHIQIPREVSNPADQTNWTRYFRDRYDSFIHFSSNESGRELFYATEVVHLRGTENYYFYITGGSTLEEAIQESRVNSAIMNGLTITARNLAEKAKEHRGTSYFTIGEEVGKIIKPEF